MEISVETGFSSERERVLRAMAELVSSKGYEETTLEQVAERAQVDPKELSRLFTDKEACAAAAVNAIVGEVMSVVAATYSPDRSEWDAGLFGIKAILELMAAHPSFAHLSYIGSRQMMPPKAHAIYVAGVEVLCAMIDRLRDSGGTAVPPAGAARAAFGSAEALVRREILAGRSEELPRLLPELVYGASVPFLGQEDALRLAQRGRELLAGTEWGDA